MDIITEWQVIKIFFPTFCEILWYFYEMRVNFDDLRVIFFCLWEKTNLIELRRISEWNNNSFSISHRFAGIEYHHAYTQTGPPKERINYSDRVTRDTQTIERGLLTINPVRFINTSKSLLVLLNFPIVVVAIIFIDSSSISFLRLSYLSAMRKCMRSESKWWSCIERRWSY